MKIPVGKILGIGIVLEAEAASIVTHEAIKSSKVHPVIKELGSAFITCLLTTIGLIIAGSVWSTTIGGNEKAFEKHCDMSNMK